MRYFIPWALVSLLVRQEGGHQKVLSKHKAAATVLHRPTDRKHYILGISNISNREGIGKSGQAYSFCSNSIKPYVTFCKNLYSKWLNSSFLYLSNRQYTTTREGSVNPLQYSCLGNPMGRGAQRAMSTRLQRVWHNLVTKPSPPHNSLSRNPFPVYHVSDKLVSHPGLPVCH